MMTPCPPKPEKIVLMSIFLSPMSLSPQRKVKAHHIIDHLQDSTGSASSSWASREDLNERESPVLDLVSKALAIAFFVFRIWAEC